MDSAKNVRRIISFKKFGMVRVITCLILNIQFSEHNPIRWGDGTTSENDTYPPDTPACGYYNEYCPDPTTSKIITSNGSKHFSHELYAKSF